jgi:hypothetical protein
MPGRHPLWLAEAVVWRIFKIISERITHKKSPANQPKGTEKVAIYQKRLFSIVKTASFSLGYSDRWWRALSYRRFSEPLFYLYNNPFNSKGLFQCPQPAGLCFYI